MAPFAIDPSNSLLPPALLAVSSFSFFIAIRLPPKSRIYISPFLFGSAALALHTSSCLAWLVGMDVLFALFTCVYILHVGSVLYIDRITIPATNSPLTLAYKIWGDPQRQGSWAGFPPRKNVLPPTPTSRTRFVIRRLIKVLLCWLLHLIFIGPLVPLYFKFTANDFVPTRQRFVRRLLSSSVETPITSREVQIRLFTSVYWIWIAYLMLDFCNVVISIFFVAILRIDAPEEWPSLFGSPLQAYSIRRFWTRFWHRFTVPSCTSTGRAVARGLLDITPGSRPEKVFIIFWTFLISGLCHSVADWQAGEPGRPMDDITFFVANFAAGALEVFVVKAVEGVLTRNGYGGLRRFLWSGVGKRVVGFAWVLGFLFWIGPKWQYHKLYAALQEMEGMKR